MSKKNTKQLFKLFSKFNQRRFPNIVTDGETWAPFFEQQKIVTEDFKLYTVKGF